MKASVVLLPADLTDEHLQDHTVVVFDVLRATTTITSALMAGVREIRVFESLDAARAAAERCPDRVLCGERHCLPPPGFDLGNSPGDFRQQHRGRVVFMCTTNGTRAIAAARGARNLLVGALVNATAVAARVRQIGRDVTLLCAGTDGAVAMEDVVGAGAVLDALLASGEVDLTSDVARTAIRTFRGSRNDLLGTLRDARGGRNVAAAGLEADIAFAASLDRLPVVGTVGEAGDALTVARFSPD